MEKIDVEVESSRLMNEEEMAARNIEEKEETSANLEFKSIDFLETKLAKKFRKLINGKN